MNDAQKLQWLHNGALELVSAIWRASGAVLNYRETGDELYTKVFIEKLYLIQNNSHDLAVELEKFDPFAAGNHAPVTLLGGTFASAHAAVARVWCSQSQYAAELFAKKIIPGFSFGNTRAVFVAEADLCERLEDLLLIYDQTLTPITELDEIEVRLRQEYGRALSETQQPADSGQKNGQGEKDSGPAVPENPAVCKLINALNDPKNDGRKKLDLALEIAKNNAHDAANIVAQVKPSRFGHLVTNPKRKKG